MSLLYRNIPCNRPDCGGEVCEFCRPEDKPMSVWAYCEGLLFGGLHVIHARRADKTGLCNWCRKRLATEPDRWRRVLP